MSLDFNPAGENTFGPAIEAPTWYPDTKNQNPNPNQQYQPYDPRRRLHYLFIPLEGTFSGESPLLVAMIKAIDSDLSLLSQDNPEGVRCLLPPRFSDMSLRRGGIWYALVAISGQPLGELLALAKENLSNLLQANYQVTGFFQGPALEFR